MLWGSLICPVSSCVGFVGSAECAAGSGMSLKSWNHCCDAPSVLTGQPQACLHWVISVQHLKLLSSRCLQSLSDVFSWVTYNAIPVASSLLRGRSWFYSVKSIMDLTAACFLCPEPVPHISKMPTITIPDLNVCDKEGGCLAASSLIWFCLGVLTCLIYQDFLHNVL